MAYALVSGEALDLRDELRQELNPPPDPARIQGRIAEEEIDPVDIGIVDIGIVEGSDGMRSDPGKARPLSERRLQRLRQVREPDADVQPDIRPLDDDPVLEVQVSKPPTN